MQITKEKLEAMYNEMTNDELCKKLDISKNTLVSYLIKNNIPLKGRGNKSKVTIV